MLSHEDGIESESESQEKADGSSTCDVTALGRKVHGDLESVVGPSEGPSEFILVAIVEPVIAWLALPEDAGERLGGGQASNSDILVCSLSEASGEISCGSSPVSR